MDQRNTFKKKLVLSTAIAGISLLGYGRRSYAACSVTTPPNFSCTGANTTTQLINTDNANVSTTPGFSVDTTTGGGGEAVSIIAAGALTFTDTNASILTSPDASALLVNSTGADGATPGSVTINSNSILNNYGMSVTNSGTGATSITFAGDISSSDSAIQVFQDSATAASTITITTTSASDVTGAIMGIYTNSARSDVMIDVNGTLNGTTAYAIYAKKLNSTDNDITVTIGNTAELYGGITAIKTANASNGNTSITVDGDVRGVSNAIYSYTPGSGSIDITTGIGSELRADTAAGVNARAIGSGDMNMTVNGAIYGYTGGVAIGIYDGGNTNDVDFTTGVGSIITTTTGNGVSLSTVGSGGVNATINGKITGTTNRGLSIDSGSGAITIITGADSEINGSQNGINAQSTTGLIDITIGGDVNSTFANSYGIFASSGAGNTAGIAVTTLTGSMVYGNFSAIRTYNDGNSTTDITIGGTVSSQTGYAVSARQSNVTGAGDLTVTTGADSIFTSDNPSGNYGGISAVAQMANINITHNGTITNAYFTGIRAYAYLGGNVDVTTDTNGSITATISNYGYGLRAGSSNGNTNLILNGDINASHYGVAAFVGTGDLSITTGADSQITGTNRGIKANTIYALTGALTMNINGDITSSGIALYANHTNSGDLNITIGSDSYISGDNAIYAVNTSTGNSTITLNGDVKATAIGVQIQNTDAASSGNLTAILAAGAKIDAYGRGIDFTNAGNGTSTLNISGDVISYSDSGIYIDSTNSIAQVTVNAGATISGTEAIIATVGTRTNLTIIGDATTPTKIIGTLGQAVDLGDLDDTVTLTDKIDFTGDIRGEAGTDTLNLNNATINLGTRTISQFEVFNFTGNNIVNGNINAAGLNLVQTAGSSLHINGNFNASSFTVSNGSELGGNNTLTTNLIIDNGGMLAPGNSIGTINVVGDVTFLTGSNFEVEIQGNSIDQVIATGNAVIQNGVTLDVVPLGAFSGGAKTFLTGTTLTGTFDTINTNGVNASVIYTATTASLLIANPSSVNAQASTIGQGSMLFGSTIEDEMVNALGSGDHYWVRTLYSNRNRQTDSSFAGFSSHVYGAAFGAQYDVSDNWDVGYAVGDMFNNTNVKLAADDTKSNSILSSIYGTYSLPFDELDMFTSVGIIGGYTSADNKRAVNDNGTILMAKSDNTAIQSGAFWQLGARTAVNDEWNIMPRLGVAYYRTDVDGYVEKTGGAAAISVDDYTYSTLKTSQSISLYNNKEISVDHVKIKPKFNVGFTQERALDRDSISGSFSTGTTTNFAIDQSDNNFFNAGLSADISFSDTLSGEFSYNHAFSDTEARNELKLDLKKRF